MCVCVCVWSACVCRACGEAREKRDTGDGAGDGARDGTAFAAADDGEGRGDRPRLKDLCGQSLVVKRMRAC